jgi:hypothetical protein
MGSNPTQVKNVWVYSVFVLGSGNATGWSPVQESCRLSSIKKLKWNEAFRGCPVLQVGETVIEEQDYNDYNDDDDDNNNTHHSELQAITALPYFNTLYSSPLHTYYGSQSSLVIS